MRGHLRRFVQLVSATIELDSPIYEFGALQVQGDAALEDLRPLFPGNEYVGCDMRPGAGVDQVLNLHELDLDAESVGTAICMDTMEHVEYPRKAVSELYRVLRPGGVLIASSVMNFPIHGFPNDYWRFTPEGFKSLLQDFETCFVGYDGADDFPSSIVAVAVKKSSPDLREFKSGYLEWQARSNKIISAINSKLSSSLGS